MIVIGAKGLAKTMLAILSHNNKCEGGLGNLDGLHFFDNVNTDAPDDLFGFPIIKSFDDLRKHFTECPDFCLGVGYPSVRKKLADKARNAGGRLCSIISASIFNEGYGNSIGDGSCIFPHVIMSNDVTLGEGCLINMSVLLSHDVTVGQYCDISPGAKLLGSCSIGDFSSIGTNAVILPDVIVGSDCRVGAGAVVTKNVPDGETWIGVPAKPHH